MELTSEKDYRYSVVHYYNGVGETLFNTDSLDAARREVIRIILHQHKTVFIMRNLR